MYVQIVNMILRLLLIAVLGDIINPDDGVVLLITGVLGQYLMVAKAILFLPFGVVLSWQKIVFIILHKLKLLN